MEVITKSTIRAGYKQTEVGLIPDDWEVKAIGELAEVRGGKRLPLGKSLIETPTSHPYIRVTDMRLGGVVLDDIKYIPEDVFPAIRNYRIFAADLFISVAGTLGIAGKIPPELDGANLTENADRITNISCDRDFLLYNLMSERIQGIIEAEKTVGAQPKLALTRIGKFRVGVPPTVTEQSAIANALSDVDGLIGALDNLIAKRRDLKRAVMQQLLTGKQRLPGFSKKWEIKRLGDLGVFKGGNGFPVRYQGRGKGDYPFYKVSDMNNDGNSTLMVNSNNWISDDVRKVLGATTFPANSIVFAKIGAAIFLERKKILSRNSCIDNNMMCFVPVAHLAHHTFFHYLFLSIQFGRFVSTTALPSLSGNELAQLELPFPPLGEQIAIAAVLSDMDAEIAELEQRRDKTRAVKQGMMQELLTGNIRLI